MRELQFNLKHLFIAVTAVSLLSAILRLISFLDLGLIYVCSIIGYLLGFVFGVVITLNNRSCVIAGIVGTVAGVAVALWLIYLEMRHY